MATNEKNRRQDLDVFYEILSNLQIKTHGFRCLSDCSGAMDWPQKGVYFFFDRGEPRIGSDSLRVVRVGTHAVSSGSRATLWGRLRTHRGRSSGAGNHRASVFRKLIGLALIQKGEYSGPAVATWGIGSSAPREIRNLEKDLEMKVTEYIGTLPFLWIEIDDDASSNSQRAYIERNSIALLSNINGCPDIPSKEWLGSCCPHNDIKESGLWNSNHVREEYFPIFLSKFELFVKKMNGGNG